MKRCIVCLAELDLFRGLESEQCIKLCNCTVKKKLSKGESLFHQDEFSNAVYLIKSGKLKLVQITEDGHEAILDVCGPGEILGELSLYQEQKEVSSAIAMEEAKICCFSRQQFRTLIQENSSFALRIISYLGKKRYDSLQKYGEDTRQTVKEKLLYLFYHFAKEYGESKGEELLIDIIITQQELADMIGASRVMVGQAIKELITSNIIGREKRYYTLKKDPCLCRHTFE
ncbi:Crp/Fnr family transcriptional regulator [Clostridium sp. PL3]|uniref:Crp/Fnr family transcriptional regulator n=1 Tax=Clostridium thailandense TaxID=2794346 RepID=A0A949TUI0_9CLOT|nr:Crp/Fnr family transcriptional regulator [Clostridium thailandense]MBV7272633.1 Crp/Fnr family transcriptional regulator [Clostridium thailandense]